jgi:hypothetical protein
MACEKKLGVQGTAISKFLYCFPIRIKWPETFKTGYQSEDFPFVEGALGEFSGMTS